MKSQGILPLVALTLASFGLFLPSPAHAGRFGKGGNDLSASAGVARPSKTTAVFENPAGLVYNSQTSLNLAASFGDSLANPVLEPGLFVGNGSLGASVGYLHPTTSGSGGSVFYGAAAEVRSLGTSFGIAGTTFASSGGGTALNAGALIGAGAPFRVGLEVRNFTGSSREFAAGLNLDLDSSASFIGDLGVDDGFGNPWIQPGLLIQGQKVSLSASYGLRVTGSGGGPSGFSDGLAAGLSFRAGQKTSFAAHYHHLSSWYAELTIGL